MRCLQVSNIEKGRCLSFRVQRESLDSEKVKLFEKKEETIPSPPSVVQRETTIDPLDPVDVPRDIAVDHKRPAWARQTLQYGRGLMRFSRVKENTPKEHIWLLFYRGICHGFLVQHETKLCGFEYRRSRVYSVECGSL
jgi:hypothetical protein